jgi:hypothetical protein
MSAATRRRAAGAKGKRAGDRTTAAGRAEVAEQGGVPLRRRDLEGEGCRGVHAVFRDDPCGGGGGFLVCPEVGYFGEDRIAQLTDHLGKPVLTFTPDGCPQVVACGEVARRLGVPIGEVHYDEPLFLRDLAMGNVAIALACWPTLGLPGGPTVAGLREAVGYTRDSVVHLLRALAVGGCGAAAEVLAAEEGR